MSEREQSQATSKGISARSLAKIQSFAQQEGIGESDLVPYFEERIHGGISIRKLATEIGLNYDSLARYLKKQSVVIPSQVEATRQASKRRWQDPEYRVKQAEVSRRILEELKRDPVFRARQAEAARQELARRWQDPEFRAINAEATRQANRRRWQEDLGFRERITEASRRALDRSRQDPIFRSRQAEATRRMWQDPGFRERHTEANRRMAKKLWQDQSFRERNAEAIRQTRINSANLDRYVLPTIHGERWDIGYAQSAWEANLARVLRFVGRDVVTHEPLRLEDNSLYVLDFLTLDNRGRFVGYEIMVHPLEERGGWDKLERVIDQYPEIVFRVVDERYYRRLERRFADRINQDSRFAGWENKDSNLKTDPDRFGQH